MKNFRPHHCTHCGDRYYRRNLLELWTARNPGHRAGWRRVTVRLCNECFSLQGAARALMLTSLQIVKGGLLRSAR